MESLQGERPNLPKPDDMARFLDELEVEWHESFHSKASVRKKKEKAEGKRKKRRPPPSSGDDDTSSPGIRPDDSGVCDPKKALVIIGCLTGNAFADRAFRNTAAEAKSDFEDRGYRTTLLDQPTMAQVRAYISDPCVKAFAYVGHGSDGDSDDANPAGRGGGDFIWPNCSEVMSASDIQFWMNGGSMDVVILHACYQGATNTAARWKAAFGVGGGNFHSWSGPCRYFQAYWWQWGWS